MVPTYRLLGLGQSLAVIGTRFYQSMQDADDPGGKRLR